MQYFLLRHCWSRCKISRLVLEPRLHALLKYAIDFSEEHNIVSLWDSLWKTGHRLKIFPLIESLNKRKLSSWHLIGSSQSYRLYNNIFTKITTLAMKILVLLLLLLLLFQFGPRMSWPTIRAQDLIVLGATCTQNTEKFHTFKSS